MNEFKWAIYELDLNKAFGVDKLDIDSFKQKVSETSLE